jgi:hypothetical protein
MSVDLLERAAARLEPLLEEIAFLGGAAIPLWITDPGAPGPRPTKDVDVVVEVASRAAWHRFEERLRRVGFREDVMGGVICRWRASDGGTDELTRDAMPSDASLLGFSNVWQAEGLAAATERGLPSGRRLRALTPAYLLATKLEAWNGRGRGDHLRSHDLEDVIALVDGREELIAEVDAAPRDLRAYIVGEVVKLLDEPRFLDAIDGFAPALDSPQRVGSVILPRLELLAGRAL